MATRRALTVSSLIRPIQQKRGRCNRSIQKERTRNRGARSGGGDEAAGAHSMSSPMISFSRGRGGGGWLVGWSPREGGRSGGNERTQEQGRSIQTGLERCQHQSKTSSALSLANITDGFFCWLQQPEKITDHKSGVLHTTG